MPHWIAMVAIVVAGWLLLAVIGGLVVGRGLRAFERAQDSERGACRHDGDAPANARRAT